MISVLFALAASSAQPAPDLLLVCQGSAVTNVETSRTDVAVIGGGTPVAGTASTSEAQTVPVEVEFEIKNGSARMHVPSFASGGAEGDANWFPVSDMVASPDEFTGKVKYGFLRGSSKFRIDRRTGKISTSSGFQGLCEKQEVQTQKF